MAKIITDFENIIIGSGGAGLTAAISLASSSQNVAILSRTLPFLSHTAAAQGGINANFGNELQDDWKWHAYDTIKGSDWIADYDSVEILCSRANEAVNFLADIGVNFDKDSNGKILQKKYGGQTLNYGRGPLAQRACSVGDRTGASMIESLYQKAKSLGVKFINYQLVIDLIIKDNQCAGAIAYDIENGGINIFHAKNTIIATGGFSHIFTESTASTSLVGNGLYLASKNNIALKDMEFVQFHPTSMYGNGILISETARSIGGKLLNINHERFMGKYAPKYQELAPRDIVSRAIATEIIAQNQYSAKHNNFVFLDLRHINPSIIQAKLGYAALTCKNFLNLDITRELIKVTPAAHYTMGGIPTNTKGQVLRTHENGETVIEGLYATGEAACLSVHGANRLGCNSLLDIIVFGMVCAEEIIKNPRSTNNIRQYKPESYLNLDVKSAILLGDLSATIGEICTKYLAINKCADGIKTAINNLATLASNMPKLYYPEDPWDQDFIKLFDLLSQYECAKHLALASLARNESRGAHYRSDSPKRDDKNFLAHSYSIISGSKSTVFFQENRRKAIELDYFQPELRNY